jgi:hypothetical protein
MGRETAFKDAGINYKQWISVQLPTTREGATTKRPYAKENHGIRFSASNPSGTGAHEQIVHIDDDFYLNSRSGAEHAPHPLAMGMKDENYCNCQCFLTHVADEEAEANPDLVYQR